MKIIEAYLNKFLNLVLTCIYSCIKFIELILIFIGEDLNDRNGLLLTYCIFFIHEFLFFFYLYNNNKKKAILGRKKWKRTLNQKVLILANSIMSLYCIYTLLSLIHENGITSCLTWGIISLYEVFSTIIIVKAWIPGNSTMKPSKIS